jgi:hypothetical protein
VAGGLDDYDQRVAALAKSWATGEAPDGRKALAQGKMGDTTLVTLNDGRKVIEKRARFNQKVNPLLSEKDMSDHEEMMGMVGHQIGVPTAAVHRIDDSTVIMDYQEGTPALQWDGLGYDTTVDEGVSFLVRKRPRQAQMLGFMDVVTQNGDRHPGNIIVGDAPDGPTMLPIDHGNAFTGVERVEGDIQPLWVYSNPEMTEQFSRGPGYRGNPERGFYSDGLSYEELQTYQQALQLLKPRWSKLGSNPEIQNRLMMERVAAMLDDAKSKARRREQAQATVAA